jgi:hypothetical protein
MCCHESEEGHDMRTGELDCPGSLRKDFDQLVFGLVDEIVNLVQKRNFFELQKIRKFIIDQRPGKAIKMFGKVIEDIIENTNQ